jgi:GNAT superfamily N-acetyltransferase
MSEPLMPARLICRITPLARHHDRSSFVCGLTSLDDFLKKYAGQYDKKGMGKTFVATRPEEVIVLGYYTLASGSVSFETIPEEARRKLPKHPIPTVHLGRLAVDKSTQGHRLGETLLLDAIQRSLKLSDEMGIHAIEVHALNEDARTFCGKYGFFALVDDPQHLYLSMKDVRKLSL